MTIQRRARATDARPAPGPLHSALERGARPRARRRRRSWVWVGSGEGRSLVSSAPAGVFACRRGALVKYGSLHESYVLYMNV